MPWYIFQTPQGRKQLFADTSQQAEKIFFQQTGITANAAQITGDSPAPSIPFLSIGSGGTGGGVAGAPALEQIDPFAAFLRTFQPQLGPLRGTLAESQLQGRAAPAGTAFTGGELLRSVRDPSAQSPSFGDESAFANWLATQGIGANFRGQSAQAFGDLASLASQRAAARGGAGTINDPVLRQILNPTDDPQGSAIAGAVSDLGEQAFRSRFSPIVANALARGPLFNQGQQLSEFRAGTGTQGFGDFVNFLRNRFGMGF